MLTGRKLSSTESKTYEALINNEITHKDFMIIINEQKKNRELKETIRMMNSQKVLDIVAARSQSYMGFLGFLLCTMRRLFKRLLYKYYSKFLKANKKQITFRSYPRVPP